MNADVPDSFAQYTRSRAQPRFSSWLRERAEPSWTAVRNHQFVEELGDGTLAETVFRRYLIQDYAFIRTLIRLVGHGVSQSPSVDAAGHLTSFLTVLTSDENDYFKRSFDALDVPKSDRTDPPLHAVTRSFDDFLLRTTFEGQYPESITALLAVEWVYLTWAEAVADGSPGAFYFREWIDLHTDDDFRAFVEWLRAEIDSAGPTLAPTRQRHLDQVFRRAIDLEVAFFDAAYTDELSP